MPERILDLHAEFRCHMAGLLPAGDFGLADALAHVGAASTGDGLDCLERLYRALLPHIDLPRAVGIRGRYAAAVARMEWVGVPIDTISLNRLCQGWPYIRDRLVAQVDCDYEVYEDGRFSHRRWEAWCENQSIRWPRDQDGRLCLDLDTFRDMAKAYPQVRPMKELRATLSLLGPFGWP
jgi:DNA polymerase-1